MKNVAILGNGAIGTFLAFKFLKQLNNNFKVTLFGDQSSLNGATVAAGAMHAVFGELEELKEDSLETIFFEMGLQSRSFYNGLFEKYTHIKTCNDTLVYLKKNASDFELRNFETVKNTSKRHNVLKESSNQNCFTEYFNNDFGIEEIIQIQNEFAFDPRKLLKNMFIDLKNNQIQTIESLIMSVNKAKAGYDVSFKVKNETFKKNFDIVINCLGAHSNNVMENDLRSIEQFQGVGTAFLVDYPNLPCIENNQFVVRTVNRGGAQCGLHLVPLNKGFYIGAGNYLAECSEPELRLDTLKYLLNGVSNEILPKKITYQMKGSVLQGLRPRSLDGLPILGVGKSPNLLWATGFNRVGLSLAPAIADILIDIILEKENSHENRWNPNRKPVSFLGSKNEFVLSRVSNALEHNLIENTKLEIDKKTKEFEIFYDKVNVEIKDVMNLPKDFEIHPDMIGILYESRVKK